MGKATVEMSDGRTTSMLLRCGVVAGPLYIALGAGQILLRDGFDMRLHALSLLSNGEYGWIQVANFLISGILVVAGAIGVRRQLRNGSGGTWLPILLMAWGIGLIGSGIFRADPGMGFPPGTPMETEFTRDGMLHFVFGAIAFYTLIAACLVAARRFARLGRRGWLWYSIASGVGFLVVFAGIASGSSSGALMLVFYAAVAWIWIWHSAFHATLVGETHVPA